VVLGRGAFQPSTDDHSAENDMFNFQAGKKAYLAQTAPVAFNSGKDRLQSSVSSDPTITQERTLEKLPPTVDEYGYGFWFRYMTLFPERLWSGKNAPWYFLARLTVN
jgi:hypothetical protein